MNAVQAAVPEACETWIDKYPPFAYPRASGDNVTCQGCVENYCAWYGRSLGCVGECVGGAATEAIGCYTLLSVANNVTEICNQYTKDYTNELLCAEALGTDCQTCTAIVESDGTTHCNWFARGKNCRESAAGCNSDGCPQSTCPEAEEEDNSSAPLGYFPAFWPLFGFSNLFFLFLHNR